MSRIDWLDSLRGLAAISVFLSHYIGAFGDFTGILPNWVLSHSPIAGIRDGFAAVALFFVLSGFVLSKKYFKPSHNEVVGTMNSIWYFYIFRFIRIWIPYAIWFFISMKLQVNGYDQTKKSKVVADFIRNLWPVSFMDHDGIHSDMWLMFPVKFDVNQNPIYFLLPQCWTLYWELVLSLILPFILILVGDGGVVWISILMYTFWQFLHARIDIVFQFTLGVILAKYYDDLQLILKNKRILLWILFVIGWCLYSNRLWFDLIGLWNAASQTCFPVAAVGSSLMILSIGGLKILEKCISFRPLRFFGKISYSFYLCHIAILITISPSIMEKFLSIGLPYPKLINMIVSFMITCLIASVSFFVIEYPLISNKQRIENILKVPSRVIVDYFTIVQLKLYELSHRLSKRQSNPV